MSLYHYENINGVVERTVKICVTRSASNWFLGKIKANIKFRISIVNGPQFFEVLSKDTAEYIKENSGIFLKGIIIASNNEHYKQNEHLY